MCAGVGNTQAAKSGLTFWFSNPESSLPVARVPDVLSKAPSLGRLWDTGYPSKSAWPPPFGAAHGGSGSLASGSCTTLAHALRPHLPPWHGPSFWDPAPPPRKQLRKHRHWTGHHWVRALTRPRACPRNPVLWGRTRLRPHAPDLSKEGHAARAHGSVSSHVPPSRWFWLDPPSGS